MENILNSNSIIYQIVIAITLIYAIFFLRRVLSAQKNGCFYHKNDEVLPPKLAKKIGNLHYIESPAGYIMNAMAFIIALIIQRLLFNSFYWLDIGIQLGISFLFMAGTYWGPSLQFQRAITAYLKPDSELDKTNLSEDTIILKRWRKRLFSNRGRIIAQWLGIGCFVGSVVLIVWFNIK